MRRFGHFVRLSLASLCTNFRWKATTQQQSASQNIIKVRDLNDRFPIVACDYSPSNPISAEKIPFDSPKIVKWKCAKCAHMWTASVIVRTVLRAPCPMCFNRDNPKLVDISEQIFREFHVTRNDRLVDPAKILASCRKKYWWTCSKCSHEFEARVKDRVSEKACPNCLANQRRKIESPAKSVLLEWHPTRNGEGDLSKIPKDNLASGWWICSTCGFEWRARISSRLKGHDGCERCAEKEKKGDSTQSEIQ